MKWCMVNRMSILVTGHKGRLGSLVVKHLEDKGYNVIGYGVGDRFSDLMDKKIDYIIHLAAKLPDGKKDDMNEYLQNNVYLTNLFLILAREKACPIFISSSYSIFFRLDKYSYSKAIIDSLAWEYKMMGVKVHLAHFPNIVYPHKNIFMDVEAKLKGRKTVIDNLDFCYVKADELAKALADLPTTKELNFKIYTTNLYEMYKNHKNIVKGKDKSFIINYNGIVSFHYGE